MPKPIVIDTLVEAFERQPAAVVRQYCAIHDFSNQETATFTTAIEGLDDEGIAQEIGCKPTTVRTYWSRDERKDQTLAHFARWLLQRAPGSSRPPSMSSRPVGARRSIVPIARRA